MRGTDQQQAELFTYGSMEQRVKEDHPLRRIHALVEGALAKLAPRFEDIYSDIGRPSIPPERLLKAMLLQVLYSIHSDRALMDHIDLHLGYRWFIGLGVHEPVWDASTFSKNRDRLLGGDIANGFLNAVIAQARSRHWLSDEQFTVDGTLIEAWASRSSYQEKKDPPAPGQGSGRGGQLLKRDVKESRTDPEAFLYRKNGSASFRLSYLGHLLRDGRHGLIAAAHLTQSLTKAEREAAVEMIEQLPVRKHRIQVAADKAYDETEFVRRLRQLKAVPYVKQYTGQRSSAIDGRTTRHARYQAALQERRLIEPIFAWLKLRGGQRRTRFRGRERVGWMFTLAAAGYNLMKMARLLPNPA